MHGLEGVLERPAVLLDGADLLDHDVQEAAGLLDRRVHGLPAPRDRPAPAHELLRTQRLDGVEGVARPVAVEGVPGVEGGLGLDQVPGEEDLLLGQPGDDVALGVAAAEVLEHEVPAVPAEVDGQLVPEGHRGPGQARDGVRALGQARHAAELGGPVLLAALHDEVVGVLVGDDRLGVEGRGAEHAHRVVVGEHQVADRLVGVLPQLRQPLGGHHGGGQGLEADQEVLPLDRPDVRVPLGREGVDALGQDLEGLLLLAEVRRGRERLGGAHVPSPSWGRAGPGIVKCCISSTVAPGP